MKELKDDYFFTTCGWMVNNLNLNRNELPIYALIYSYHKSNLTFNCSIPYIMQFTKLCRKAVRNAIDTLIEKKYIFREDRNGTSNIYTINKKFLPQDINKTNANPYPNDTSTQREPVPKGNQYPKGTAPITKGNGTHTQREHDNIQYNIQNNIPYNIAPEKVVSESEKDKQDNLPSKNEDDSMNEEVSQILNLYQELNPHFTANDIERLIALIEEYPSNSIKKAMEKAKSRNTTSIGYIEKVLRNPITAKDTDKKDISPIDFVESNPVMKKCYDSLSELYIPSKQEEYSTCKELIKLWTNEQGNIKPETEIEAITERIKKAIEFFLPEYKKKIEAGNIQYVLSLHNFIAKAKWKDAERQQQAQSAKKEIEPEYTQEPIEEDLHSLKPLQH